MKREQALAQAKKLAAETGDLWYMAENVGNFYTTPSFTFQYPTPYIFHARVWPDGRVDTFSYTTEYPLSHYTE